jgi:hypothetical protein
MSFVRGSIRYRDTNFWIANPLVQYIKPFNELFDTDGGEELSSRTMWCIYFMCDPDEDNNIFYRIPIKDRQDMLKETFHSSINWEDDLIKRCIEIYPDACLTSIQKTLKDKKEWLLKRESFITTQVYDLENYDKLDKMASASKKIWDEFKKTEEEFQAEKGKITVKGGRQQSKTERKEL